MFFLSSFLLFNASKYYISIDKLLIKAYILRALKDYIMYAVIETGGKQYKVQKDDVITVEKLNASGGDKVQFNSVLLTGGEKIQIGSPHVKGAGVQALVLEQLKSKKVLSFVKRRRKSSWWIFTWKFIFTC